LGFLRAKLRQSRNSISRVVRSAARGAIPGVLEECLPRGPLAKRIQFGLRRVLQRQDVAFYLAILRGQCCSGDSRISQARERLFVFGYKGCMLSGCEQLGGESIRKSGFLFV